MKRILVPVSFSKASANALKQAFAFGQHTGSVIDLLHCFHPQPFAREYDFGKEDYDSGIRKIMVKFYHECVGSMPGETQFVTHKGSLSEVLPWLSRKYDLLVLSRKPGSESKFNKWFTDKIFYISTKALCPVLITSSRHQFSHDTISSVWHIQRRENETELVARKLQTLHIDPQAVVTKSLQQETFVSEFWKKIATYSANHNKAVLKDIDEAFGQETIDLLVVVNHRRGLFDSFVKGDAFRLISQFDMPIIILQTDTPDV